MHPIRCIDHSQAHIVLTGRNPPHQQLKCKPDAAIEQHYAPPTRGSNKLGKWKRRLVVVPSVEALVEVDGVLAGHHLILAGAGAGAGAAPPLGHLRSAAGRAPSFLLRSG
jgi:hypothetical protein